MDPISSQRRSPLLCRSRRIVAVAALGLCSGLLYAQPDPPPSADSAHRAHVPEITDIRHWSAPNSTRIVINLDGDAKYDSAHVTNPDRIYVDIKNSRLGQFAHVINIDDDAYVKDIRAAQFTADTTRIVLDVKAAADYSVEMMSNPARLVIDVHSHHTAAPAKAKDTPQVIDAATKPAPAPAPAPVTAPIKTAATSAPTPIKTAATSAPTPIKTAATSAPTPAKIAATPVADKKSPPAAAPANAPHETLPQHPTPYVYKEPFYVSPEARAAFTAKSEAPAAAPTPTPTKSAAPAPTTVAKSSAPTPTKPEPTKSESAKSAPTPPPTKPSTKSAPTTVAKSEPKTEPKSAAPAATTLAKTSTPAPTTPGKYAPKPIPNSNELTTLAAEPSIPDPAPTKPATKPAPVPEKTVAKSAPPQPKPESAVAKSAPPAPAPEKSVAKPEPAIARAEPPSAPPITTPQPAPAPAVAKSEPAPTPAAPEKSVAAVPTTSSAPTTVAAISDNKPARSDPDVALDANGHETGVAHPPQDVTITPDDDNVTIAPEKPSIGSALGPTAPAKSSAPPPALVEVATASTPPAPSNKPAAAPATKPTAAHHSAPATTTTAPRHIIADDSQPASTNSAPEPDASASTTPPPPAPAAGKKSPPTTSARTTKPAPPTKPAPHDNALALSAAATISHSETAAAAPHHPAHPATTTAAAADSDDIPPATEVAVSALPAAPDSHAKSSAAKPASNSKSSRNKKSAKPDAAAATDPDAAPEQSPDVVRAAAPTADGERSLTRALGLKIGRIVIDAGHGGHDAGSIGPDGLEEKDVTLDIALRLGKLLKQRLGADVIYTRKDDRYVPLQERTTIANREQADLFVSIHANSSSDSSARGVETYYLNFTSSPGALEVAARENAVSELPIHDLQDLVKKITLKDKLDESKEFANDVERDLYDGVENHNSSLKDRGVKQAPFVVLIGANMPSILTEISFVSNPEDARQLRDPAYRQRIADALYHGIAKYMNGLSSVRVAENRPHGGN